MLTCFMILINDNAVFYSIMYLDGWNHVAALVFWFLYIILMVFILFNFLIAIIVDAFMDIKVRGAVGWYADTWPSACPLRLLNTRP